MTILLCLPAIILAVIVKTLPDIAVVTNMVLSVFIPVFTASFVLIGLSEFMAARLGLFERHFAMYRKMHKNLEFEDIENRSVNPAMTLVYIHRNKKTF